METSGFFAGFVQKVFLKLAEMPGFRLKLIEQDPLKFFSYTVHC